MSFAAVDEEWATSGGKLQCREEFLQEARKEPAGLLSDSYRSEFDAVRS